MVRIFILVATTYFYVCILEQEQELHRASLRTMIASYSKIKLAPGRCKKAWLLVLVILLSLSYHSA
jgi:hypothetical protein